MNANAVVIDYTWVESPIGRLLLTAGATGLCGVHFAGERHCPPLQNAWRESSQGVLAAAAAQLGEYFMGVRRAFELPLAPAGTLFQHAVWLAIADVGYGRTATYAEIARRIERSTGARAVGAATGRNPLSIVVPCHRIMGIGGRLTGYAGGIERKRALLALENRAGTDQPAPA
jgi:methylated-DNA-[protein]-cysteine S-methyltransferase